MRVRNEVERVIDELGIHALELSDTDAISVFGSVAKQHAIEGDGPLWERLRVPGHQDADGWKSAASFFEGQVVLFSDADAKKFGYRLAANDVTKVLEECFGFVFYLTDDTFSTLVCFNDHDMLIVSRLLDGDRT